MKRKIIPVIFSSALLLTPICSITALADEATSATPNSVIINNDINEYVEVIDAFMIQNKIEGDVSVHKIDGLEKVVVVCEEYEGHIKVKGFIESNGFDVNKIHYGFTTYESGLNPPDILMGDANCDGSVDMADAVLIMQALANPNKYGVDGTAEHHLTEHGKVNGDMDGDGLTVGDAQAIQRILLGLTDTVSESSVMPQIKIYHSASVSDAKYTEMKVDEVVSIETDYNPAMSDWSGIGILLEFESKDYPITLSTNEGHFTTWDIEEGSGPIENVGKTYNIGNEGYIFWTPDNLHYDENYVSEILIRSRQDRYKYE